MKFPAIILSLFFCCAVKAQLTNIATGQNISQATNFSNALSGGGGGGGGALSFIDDFSRANADPISNPASDGSGTWLTPIGHWQQAKISGNASTGHTGSGFAAAARVTSPTFNADQTNTITLGVGTGQGVGVRMQTTGPASGYLCKVFSSTVLAIYDCVDAGTPPTENLLPFWTVPTMTTSNTVTLGISSNVMVVILNATNIVGFATNSTYTTGQPWQYVGDGTTILKMEAH